MPGKVLLADPDDLLLEAYGSFLKGRGFQVATAKDGLSCVDRLRAFRPDVLVLNPQLPWGTAEGVLALMHEEDDLTVVPVIALCGDSHPAPVSRIGSFHVNGSCPRQDGPGGLAEAIAALRRP
jgi:DNA-binding response OmpR family regulator